MFERRDILKAAGATLCAGPFLRAGPAAAADLSPVAAAARDAWIYGVTIVETAGARARTLEQVGPNRLLPVGGLMTPARQAVTTPNNDTIYSRAWINLAERPARITLPRAGSRYLSVALMDMYSNNFAILGTRTTGGDGGTFMLVGPTAATDDPAAIRAPTPWVWMLSRILVNGEGDLAAATAIQRQLRLEGGSARRPVPAASRAASWDAFLTTVQALVVENPPPATDDLLFDRVAPLGLTRRGGFSVARFSSAQAAEIQAGFAVARRLTLGRWDGRVADGWIYPKSTIGDFGQDYAYRAQVAISGLAALPRVEAMYLRPVDQAGATTFDSGADWQLTLPRDRLPPVDGFWSLSMYRATPDGQFFFFDNPIDRYAIGDRTPGLRRDPDGGVTIRMSRREPGGSRVANWLPLPTDAPFAPFFRAYLPRDSMMEGSYALPPIRRV